MKNINTKDYWETRFKTKNWGKSGNRQTREYAKANIAQMILSNDFNGSILDYGCALGDAIPIYHQSFPNAKLKGVDFSEAAIEICKDRFGDIADFESGDHTVVTQADIIIASHVMEHLTDDSRIVEQLLQCCKELYVFVPYKENPLYREHVNYYEKDYYNQFNVLEKKEFLVSFDYKLGFKELLKTCLKFKFTNTGRFSKEIIMFRLKGSKL